MFYSDHYNKSDILLFHSIFNSPSTPLQLAKKQNFLPRSRLAAGQGSATAAVVVHQPHPHHDPTGQVRRLCAVPQGRQGFYSQRVSAKARDDRRPEAVHTGS